MFMAPYKNPEDQKRHDKAYYQRNRDKILAHCKEIYRLKHPIVKRKRHTLTPVEKNKRWREENPHKSAIQTHARRHTCLASNCSNCETSEHLERHHPDYSKPLQVITLCHSCHMKLHPRGKARR